jgi:hypothetical protein
MKSVSTCHERLLQLSCGPAEWPRHFQDRAPSGCGPLAVVGFRWEEFVSGGGLQFDEITIGIAEKDLTARRIAAETEGDTLRRKLGRNDIEIPDAQGDMTIVGKGWVSRKITFDHYVQFLIANGKPGSSEIKARAVDFSESEDGLVKLARPFKVTYENRGVQVFINVYHCRSFLGSLPFDLKTDFQTDLEFLHLPVDNPAALFDNLKPIQVTKSLRGFLDSRPDGFGKAGRRSPHDFDNLVCSAHVCASSAIIICRNRRREEMRGLVKE